MAEEERRRPSEDRPPPRETRDLRRAEALRRNLKRRKAPPTDETQDP